MLFLDDLQWLDTATLNLLEHLATHAEARHLLLIAAYRDNEVGPAHPLTQALEVIREGNMGVCEIVLAPLGRDDIGRFIADSLHCEPERARSLAQLVHDKTHGNPFFAIQFVTELAEEGLLTFDPIARGWRWDVNRILAKRYTDHVADLMVGKLKRFSATTQEALKQLACLGNFAEIATLTLVHEQPETTIHKALWEAVHVGLVLYQDSAYKFLHDRIQQAAYSLISNERRAEVHLRIGRVLLASTSANNLAKHLFDVANHFNRGVALLVDPREKAQAATVNLRAGRKAKASTAYGSACVYLAAGMALLDESDWGSQYELTFNLWLERAECEFLAGNFDEAEQLIAVLLRRGISKVDQATVYQLKILLHSQKSENLEAVDSALTCLRLFGINLSPHPSWEQVQAEYETVLRNLEGRSIESLINLPPMRDPELQAAMQVLSILLEAAYFTDFHLFCLHLCRMVNITMKHGATGASAHAYVWLGFVLGPTFHRYREGYRLGKPACELVERPGFTAYQAKVQYAMGTVAFWTQPIGSVIDIMRGAFRTAIDTSALTFACYSILQSVIGLLLRNDPLEAAWRETERGLDFARKAKYLDAVDIFASQQRFIAVMRGRTATFSTFSDANFDEAAFEARLTGNRTTTTICYYWILKLKARFLSGDHAAAFAAAKNAKALLWAVAGQIYLLDYFFYTALTVAAQYETAWAEDQTMWRDLLTAHCEQLRTWAEIYPPTFADKYALVLAEVARLEGRYLDAERLYEEAIRSACEQGFVQNEGLANELAANFYAGRGFDKIARLYLQSARSCYVGWGADGKVRQLDSDDPRLRPESDSPRFSTSTGMMVEAVGSGDRGKNIASCIRRDRSRPAHRDPDDDRPGTRRRPARSADSPAGRRAEDRGGGQNQPEGGRGRGATGGRDSIQDARIPSPHRDSYAAERDPG